MKKSTIRLVATVLVASMIHLMAFPILARVAHAATVAAAVSEMEAQGQNPNSSVILDSNGTPIGAQGTYYPSETNMLLGRTPLLTPLECVKRYGAAFCACQTLQSGEQYCYYNRPAAGYYGSMEACENVWGAGHCVCSEPDKCRLYDQPDEASQLSCLGQVYLFSGEKFECRKAGIYSAGKNCCNTPGKLDDACGFENMAHELGMDDLAMTAVSLGTKLGSLAGYDVQQMLANKIAEVIVENWIEAGSIEGIASSMTSLLGDHWTDFVLDNLTENLSSEIIKTAAEKGALQAAQQAAVAEVAAMLSTVVSVAGWVYFAYQCYNMIKEMQQCTPGEMMLGCKIAKGVCHSVGTRCKVKAFGACLQDMKVYCCFSTKFARIINEQGRPQIGRGWGGAKNADCRGFYVDEFARLDMSRMDLGEFTDDLIREMNPNIADKLVKATKNLTQGLGAK